MTSDGSTKFAAQLAMRPGTVVDLFHNDRDRLCYTPTLNVSNTRPSFFICTVGL